MNTCRMVLTTSVLIYTIFIFLEGDAHGIRTTIQKKTNEKKKNTEIHLRMACALSVSSIEICL